eukprot:CAMPEP_0178429100 /NCGR_PEP_ID=MMETSP0689_2-20121128/30625_1 /TAXON_ID=160604 /ORGANISM="Amphidinium massartii, Strain CS-259" /LENGTH=300 /DNA_ID=CAMNT_0020050905 /DNA_START=122 /DNA_END=1021 /DNA_ORIENTATION=-
MLPIAKHGDVFSPCFDEPHNCDFAAACAAFGIPHVQCSTAEEFTAAFASSQRGVSRASCIEAKISMSHDENAVLHRRLGEAVGNQVRGELLSQLEINWSLTHGGTLPPVVLLHGWMGEMSDWSVVSKQLAAKGHDVLVVDLPGHGSTEFVGTAAVDVTPWKWSILSSMPMVVEALSDLLERLCLGPALLCGYSLGGRVAMAIASAHPEQVLGVVALSANPGISSQSPAERIQRYEHDVGIAARLARCAVPSEGSSPCQGEEQLSDFLHWWYDLPLWADLAKRKPAVYEQMLSRRLQNQPV